GLGQHAADGRLADRQQPGGAADGAGHDDGPEHFGLPVTQFVVQGVRSMPICYTLSCPLRKYCSVSARLPCRVGFHVVSLIPMTGEVSCAENRGGRGCRRLRWQPPWC